MNRLSLVFAAFVGIYTHSAIAAPRGLPETKIPNACGTQIHFTGANYKEAKMIAQAGFKFVRLDVRWYLAEKTKGVYDFDGKQDVKPLFNHWIDDTYPYQGMDGLLDALEKNGIRAICLLEDCNPLYDNRLAPHTSEARAAFARFAAAYAARYKGRGVIWEIWNEPNGGLFWTPQPNPKDYVALAKETYAAIKAADPDAFVVGPALCGGDLAFFSICLDHGLLDAVDAVSIHPYGCPKPEDAAGVYKCIRSMIAGKGRNMPVISGEWGYSQMPGFTEEQQAQFLVRMQLSNLACDVPLSIWYDWHDDGTAADCGEHHFGVVRYDFTPKPAYNAMQILTRELYGCKLVERIAARGDEYILRFKGPYDYRLAAWSTGEPKSVEVPCDADQVTLVTMDGKRKVTAVKDGRLKLELSQSPLYVEVGKSLRYSLEDAAEVSVSANTLTALISNPMPMRASGTLSIDVTGQTKPLTQRFTLEAGGKKKVTYKPDFVWDGRGEVKAAITAKFDGQSVRAGRTAILDTSHISIITPVCPTGKLLQFKITGKPGIAGTLKLNAVSGLKAQKNSTSFIVDKDTLVSFPLTEPAPKQFSFSYDLTDSAGRLLVRSPKLTCTMVEDWSFIKDGAPVTEYTLYEGEGASPARTTLAGAKLKGPEGRQINACRVNPVFDQPHQFIRMYPMTGKTLPMLQKPLKMGMWVYGNGAGDALHCRMRDAKDEFYQARGYKIDWNGWRYIFLPLDGTNSDYWFGDGNFDDPGRWESIFLLESQQGKPTDPIYLGPMMLISTIDAH